MSKQIIARSSIAPNYLYHLMAVARVVFDSDYAERYKDSVAPRDIALLQQHRELISFGAGSAGELIDVIIALPMIANLTSATAFTEYFQDVDKVAQSHDIYPFMKKYRLYPEYMQPWFSVGHEDMRVMVEHRDEIAQLGASIARNFTTYETTVWPKEKPCLDLVAAKVNEHFADKHTINAWEKVTGIEYERPAFYVELASAIKNGPNANSFAYDHVVFYHETPWDKFTHLVSHEIGTHLLVVIFREFQTAHDIDPSVLYHAMESLAMFYNMQVLETTSLSYTLEQYAGKDYIEFYDALHVRNPLLTPREMLRKGMEWVGK